MYNCIKINIIFTSFNFITLHDLHGATSRLVPVMQKCWFRWCPCGGKVRPFHVTWKIKWSFHNSREIKQALHVSRKPAETFSIRIWSNLHNSATWLWHFISKAPSYSTLPHSYTSFFTVSRKRKQRIWALTRKGHSLVKKESRSAWQQTRISSGRNSRVIAVNVSYFCIRVSSVKVSKVKFITQKGTETYKICLFESKIFFNQCYKMKPQKGVTGYHKNHFE